MKIVNKKRNSTGKIITVLVMLVIVVGCLCGCGDTAPKGKTVAEKYSDAQALLSVGKYADAATAFEELGSYEESAMLMVYCRAAAAGERGDYTECFSGFNLLGNNYKDVKLMVPYYEARQYEDEVRREAAGGDYLHLYYAAQKYDAISAVKDSKDRAKACRDTMYDKAMEYKTAGRYEKAWELFFALGNYKDSAAQNDECRELAKQRDYDAALALKNGGKYEEAIAAFEALGDFSDSRTQITDTKYVKANALKAAGDYAGAYAIYAAITGYKDVDSIIADDENISAVAARLAAYKTPGNYVTFGSYYQSNNSTKEPVEWLVLDYDASTNRALLISRYALDCKKYNEKRVDITWEKCTLRSWLNGKFLQAAFSAEEQKAIPTVTVSADKNPSFSTSPGNATQDKVFLLSIAEVNKYFKNDEARKCAPTQYAINNKAGKSSSYKVDGKATCFWWLRSPGCNSRLTTDVYDGGTVDYDGLIVDYSLEAVRPALYIDLNLLP